jgi:TRAP-type C4-dicarboxylate transport system permease small subunit
MRRVVDWINNFFEGIESFFIVLFIVVMLFLSFSQVILRLVFHIGFVWADDLLRHLVLWVGFIGASIATKKNKHINIDIFSRTLPLRAKPFVEFIILIFSAVIAFFLFLAGVNFTKMEREFMEMSVTLKIPLWILMLIIPIGFMAMSIRFFVNGIFKLWEGVRGGDEK